MINNTNNIKIRLNRSELAVPGSRIDFFEKAAKSDADIIFLDLEDSVSISQKSSARANVIEAVNDIDWRNKTLSIRHVNQMKFYFKTIKILYGHSENED